MSRSRSGQDRRSREARRHRDASDPSFRCCHCRRWVGPAGHGSKHRNHCPACLFSLHLDRHRGDRSADCGGPMEPIAIEVRDNGEWALVHRCRRCGELGNNRIASDDNEFVLMQIASRPIAFPAFPLEPLARGATATRSAVERDEEPDPPD